ncbi:MAG: DUF2279 domain-containing protein [Bacteroidia bacterium]|nr:DUF2279 domain-containing protein [Bacteroidia bacterium]
MYRGTFLLILFISFHLAWGQKDSTEANILYPDTFHKGRLIGVLSAQGVIYAGSITGLYFLWYKNYPQSNFHLYDDNSEWLQMDKMGHLFSSYFFSRLMYTSYRWAGVEEKRAILFGSLLTYAFLLNIEILDGFSSEWGFSWGDIAANTAGCLLFAGQQLLWEEQRFSIKYSYHPTKYPGYNPDLLGNNLLQNLVKDYNGMTVWLSGNISSFMPKRSKFPKWINVAVGYGAEGLGVNNTDFTRYRKFYLSLDVDFTRIPTRSKALKVFFNILNLIKVPFPALEYNTRGEFKFHPLYF